MDVIIYHNPDCGTSRNTLGLIRNAGVEPHVIEYLKTPADARCCCGRLIDRMGVPVRAVLREKGTPYPRPRPRRSGPDGRRPARRHDGASDPDQPADRGDAARACGCAVRPKHVLDLLPPQRGEFRKEDGELVVDAAGRRVRAAA